MDLSATSNNLFCFNVGEAMVLQKFDVKDGKKKVSVAGCRCVEGVLLKSEMYHVVRRGENIFTGKYIARALSLIQKFINNLET